MVFYDEEDDMIQDQDMDQEYEFEYEQETITELYDLCLKPTFIHTAEHFIPLLAACFLFKLISQCCKYNCFIIFKKKN